MYKNKNISYEARSPTSVKRCNRTKEIKERNIKNEICT
jgi:hypothetical protein